MIVTADLDTGVGLLVEAIEKLDIADNASVIYMSDNGGGGGGGGRKGKVDRRGRSTDWWPLRWSGQPARIAVWWRAEFPQPV